MRARGPQRRWALSLADLALLIACILLLSVRTGHGIAPQTSAIARPQTIAISRLFAPGEAVLQSGAADDLRRIIGLQRRVTVRVAMDASASARLDAWELAAARTAAIARALRASPTGQHLTLRLDAPIPNGAVVRLATF